MNSTSNTLQKVQQDKHDKIQRVNFDDQRFNQQENSFFFQDFSHFLHNQPKIIQKHDFFQLSESLYKKEQKEIYEKQIEQNKFSKENKSDQRNKYKNDNLKKINLKNQTHINSHQFQFYQQIQNFQENMKIQRQSLFNKLQSKIDLGRQNSKYKQNDSQKNSNNLFSEVISSHIQSQCQNYVIKNVRQNQTGLKYMSELILNIVKNSQKVTHHEVVCKLLDQMKKGSGFQENNYEQKKQNNIKRRAYDAINVMIAAELVEKKSKYISLKNSIPQHKEQEKIKLEYESNKISIEQKTKQINLKKSELHIVTQKQRMLNKWFYELAQKRKNVNHDELINFPFLCFESQTQNFTSIIKTSLPSKSNKNQSKQNESTCDQSYFDDQVKIKFKPGKVLKKGIRIYGDIDFITEYAKYIENEQKLKKTFSDEKKSQQLALQPIKLHKK